MKNQKLILGYPEILVNVSLDSYDKKIQESEKQISKMWKLSKLNVIEKEVLVEELT